MPPRVVTTNENGQATLATVDGNAYPVAATDQPGPGTGIPFYVFSLAPGLTQEVNTYNTSNALYAGLAAQRGAGVSGQVKVSINGPSGASPSLHWTAEGAQDMDDVWLTSQQTTPSGYTLLVDEGVTWTIDTLWDDTPIVGANTATPIVTVSALLFLYIINEGEFSSLHANAPFFHVVSGGVLSVLMNGEAAWGGSGFGGSGTEPVVSCDSGGSVTIIALAGSAIFANSIASVAGATIQVFYDASSTVDQNQPAAAGGTITYNLLDVASLVQYTAAVAANWSGTNPTSVANALDRIAAKVGPIP